MVRNTRKTGRKTAQKSGRKTGKTTPKPSCHLNFSLARCSARVCA
jgi:hypothetical protein